MKRLKIASLYGSRLENLQATNIGICISQISRSIRRLAYNGVTRTLQAGCDAKASCLWELPATGMLTMAWKPTKPAVLKTTSPKSSTDHLSGTGVLVIESNRDQILRTFLLLVTIGTKEKRWRSSLMNTSPRTWQSRGFQTGIFLRISVRCWNRHILSDAKATFEFDPLEAS